MPIGFGYTAKQLTLRGCCHDRFFVPAVQKLLSIEVLGSLVNMGEDRRMGKGLNRSNRHHFLLVILIMSFRASPEENTFIVADGNCGV
jgi:hypothetical protein